MQRPTTPTSAVNERLIAFLNPMKMDPASWAILAAGVGLLLGAGCGQRSVADDSKRNALPAPQLASVNLPAPPNPGEPAQPAQGELMQKLLDRIEVLEKKEAERADSAHALSGAHEEEVRKLVALVEGLKDKVARLETGRVLPELAVSAENGPTPQELDQKIKVLERKDELAVEAADARAKESPRLDVGRNGFAFSSGDSNFVLRLKGVLQVDARQFIHDNPRSNGNDSFLIRRARPIFEGTLFRDFDYQFVPDFGGSSVQIFDANLNYRLWPELQLRAGKFKGPVGLEQLQSDINLNFNERSLVTDLVPTRNVGVEVWGQAADGALEYGVGVFNGTGDTRNSGTSDFGDDKEFSGRVFAQPFKNNNLEGLRGLGLGLGASYSDISSNSAALPGTTGGTLPGYTTDGQQQFFAYNPVVGSVVADGAHWRLSPQGYYYWGAFGLLGEYVISEQAVLNTSSHRRADLRNTAWQIAAQWVLTGEHASFGGIIPQHPFSIHGEGWGAWQLVGRFGQLDVDQAAFQGFSNPATSARSATSWSAGVNWWLNKNVRLLTSFSHTSFQGGGTFNPADALTLASPATVTHQDENVVFTRLQLSF